MILYVNGDSHTAGAEAVNPHAFASDDKKFTHLKLKPHPDNLAVSWGKKLSTLLKTTSFVCDAQSGSSNDRIIRTTKEWIKNNDYNNTLIIIGWSTWEREEWLIDDVYYQLNSSGDHCVPKSHSQQYKDFILTNDEHKNHKNWNQYIWNFHVFLRELNIPHIFFNSNHCLNTTDKNKDWGVNYVAPYDMYMTFDAYLKTKHHKFGPGFHYHEPAHAEWADFLFNYINKNNII